MDRVGREDLWDLLEMKWGERLSHVVCCSTRDEAGRFDLEELREIGGLELEDLV